MRKEEYLEIEKKLAETQRKAAKINWPCMCPKCTERAINSHLLQRKGILNHVMEGNHVYEVTREDVFKWHENYPVKFKEVGINKAISYPLFCSKHDTDIFLPIESGVIDFDDYRSQLLFSYRAICAEIRKKEFALFEVNENMVNADEIKKEEESILVGEDKGIKDLMYYKYLLEDELNNNRRKFTFYHYSYPMIGIYASATMSYEIFDSRTSRQVNIAAAKKVWDSLFIHIIPQNESTEIIIGYHNNHTSRDMDMYAKSWKDLSNEDLGYKLTDLFVAHVEDWGMSPRLYARIPEERFDKFFKLQSEYFLYEVEQKTNVNYNFFEGLLP